MTVKKSYDVGDTVWVYGISPGNVKSAKGKVVKILDLSDIGYQIGPHYLIAIPTHIEDLLEIRTWEDISQDEHGPVGALRSIGSLSATLKRANRVGFAFDTMYEDDDGPTAEEIHAALEKSQKDVTHSPLNLKPEKPKRRYFKKKKA